MAHSQDVMYAKSAAQLTEKVRDLRQELKAKNATIAKLNAELRVWQVRAELATRSAIVPPFVRSVTSASSQ